MVGEFEGGVEVFVLLVDFVILLDYSKRDRRPCIFCTFRAWVFLTGIEEVSPAYIRKVLKNKDIPACSPLNCFVASFLRPSLVMNCFSTRQSVLVGEL